MYQRTLASIRTVTKLALCLSHSRLNGTFRYIEPDNEADDNQNQTIAASTHRQKHAPWRIRFQNASTADYLYRRKRNGTTRYISYNQLESTLTYTHLQQYAADFSFNAQSRFAYFNGTVGITNSFDRYDICVLVPSSVDSSLFFNLLCTLSTYTWLLTISAVFVIPFIFYVVQQIERCLFVVRSQPFPDQRELKEIFIIFFQSFFGDTIVTMPRSTSLRIIILAWCLFSFLMTTAFAAKLISALVTPMPEPNIDTIDQLLRSNLTVYTIDSTFVGIETEVGRMQHGRSERAYAFYDILDRSETIDDDEFNELINNTTERNNAFVVNKYTADYMVHKHFDKIKGRSHYHVMDECLFHLPMVYFVEKSSPYLARINELLSQFHEAGFMSYWHRWSVLNDTLNNNYYSAEMEETRLEGETTKVVITIEHLASAFALWAAGVGLSFSVFLMELNGIVT